MNGEMKGLLLKDWYLTVHYLRTLLLVVLVMVIASAMAPGNRFFIMYPEIMVALLPVTVFSYDDREKWTTYVQAFPVSRRQYVTEKYIFGALCQSAFAAVQIVLYLLAGIRDFGTLIGFSVSLGLMACAIVLPLMMRFGVEKGRLIYSCVLGVFCALIIYSTVSEQGQAAVGMPAPMALLPAAAVYVLSWRISIVLYEKREL